MNIFELATQNSDALRVKYQDLTNQFENQNHLSLLKRFVEQVESHGKIGVNMRQYTVNSLLLFQSHQNMYEWAEERARESTKDQEQIIKERLGSYYEKRMAFDHFFDDGERFRYGALNIGGLGAPRYGEYCVILTKAFLDNCPCVVFVKEDSLNTYMLDDSSVHLDRLKAEIADQHHVHILAALKHRADLKTKDAREWETMVCCSDDYVEAITTQEISVSAVECVRMSREKYDEYHDYLFEDFLTELDDFERYQVEYFRIMQKQLKDYNIELEPVDEN